MHIDAFTVRKKEYGRKGGEGGGGWGVGGVFQLMYQPMSIF